MTASHPTAQGPLKLHLRHSPWIKRQAAPGAPVDIELREELIYTLGKAAELEHLIICQYLYAAFSLKRTADEGIPAELEPV